MTPPVPPASPTPPVPPNRTASPTAGTTPPPAAATKAAGSVSGASRAARRRSHVQTVGEKIETALISKPSIWFQGVAAGLIALYVLIFRFPQTFQVHLVSARQELADAGRLATEFAAVESVDPSTLTDQVALAERFLFPSKTSALAQYGEIEKAARKLGFQVQFTPQPVPDRIRQVPGVEVVGLSMKLQPVPEKGLATAPHFHRLVSLLELLGQSTNKVEISHLMVAGSKAGGSSAQVDLEFWSLKPHETTAAQ